MFDALKKVYKKDTELAKNQLLSQFYSFNYDKSSDVMANISCLQNLSFRLNNVGVSIDDVMLMLGTLRHQKTKP